MSKALILVTGATGFIGKNLVERLMRQNYSIRVLVRNPDKLSELVKDTVDVITGDLADLASLRRAVKGVDIIYHCAANVRTWDMKQAYEEANVKGVKNLLEAIAQESPNLLRLIHISTVDVYGFPQHAADEHTPTALSGFGYGDSKRQGEMLVYNSCSSAGIPFTIMRPANVIGPCSPFISRIGIQLASGVMLKIDGGRCHAGLIYIDNLIDCLLWAARDPKANKQCYNVRDPYDVSWNEFLSKFKKDIQGKGVIVGLPYAIADAAAACIEFFYRIFLPSQEPVLHRLLIRLFGRTCGHSSEKIRTHSKVPMGIEFDEAMKKSTEWFLRKGDMGIHGYE